MKIHLTALHIIKMMYLSIAITFILKLYK